MMMMVLENKANCRKSGMEHHLTALQTYIEQYQEAAYIINRNALYTHPVPKGNVSTTKCMVTTIHHFAESDLRG